MQTNIPLVHIVAQSENSVIGKNNSMPWKISRDLAYFKSKTLHKPVIMGFNTFASLRLPLIERLNIVLTSKPQARLQEYENTQTQQIKSQRQVSFVADFQEAIAQAEEYLASNSSLDPEIYIIGGEKIYQQTIEFVDKLYVTQIYTKHEGDAFYPKIEARQWQLESSSQDFTEGEYSFCFQTYIKQGLSKT